MPQKAALEIEDFSFLLFSSLSVKIIVIVNILSSTKFQQEVILGRYVCLCACTFVCLCARMHPSLLPTIDSRGIAGDFSGCGQVQDTTHQFGGEAEYSLIFLYVCAYTTMAQN